MVKKSENKEVSTIKNEQEIKELGLKLTAPRIKIMQILEQSKERHMSAEDIYKKFMDNGEDIGLATIYRVLTQFESAGLVLRHKFEEGHAVFELDNREHHDHLVCIKCGLVEEFVDQVIEKRQVIVAQKYGFKVTCHSLYLYGLCKKCNL